MRNRSRSPVWRSEASGSPRFWQPRAVPWLQQTKWYFRVKTWQITMNITDSFGNNIAGTTTFGWNKNNNPAINPPGFDVPSSEAHLATGWQIEGAEITNGLAIVAVISLFRSDYSASGLPGRGTEYTTPANDTYPYIELVAGNAITDRLGGSAIVFTMDGLVIPMGNVAPVINPYTGTIDIDPFEYWEYRNSSGGDPMYNSTTGAAIGGRRTDELI